MITNNSKVFLQFIFTLSINVKDKNIKNMTYIQPYFKY